MSADNGPKAPKLGDSYTLFKKEVKLWESTTKIEEKRRAGTIVLSLPDKAKEQALEIDLTELQNGRKVTVNDVEQTLSGIDCLLEVLDGIYLENAAKEKFKCYDKFRNIKRGDNQSVRDFILDFDKALKQLSEHGIDLPQPVIAYELLRGCNVDSYKYSVAVAIVGELNYENMKQTVKNITEIQGLPKSSNEEKCLKVVKEEEHTYYADSQDYSNDQDEDSDFCEPQNMYYSHSYGRGRGRYRNTQPRGMYGYNTYSSRGDNRQRGNTSSSTQRGTNPRGRDGKPLACGKCQSIYHFARDCPENKRPVSTNANFFVNNITLFQKVPGQSSNLEEFTRNNFGLAILDSGCNTTVCGQLWLDVYLESLTSVKRNNVVWKNSEMQFKFGDNESTKSKVCCTFPAVVCNTEVTITAQVVDDMIPLLIGKQSMRKAKMVLDFRNDTVSAFGVRQQLIFGESGHCSITLSSNTVHDNVCLCNTNDLVLEAQVSDDFRETALKLHKQFAHPPADSLKSLLRSAGKLNGQIASAIDAVSSQCEICRRYKKPANRPVVCIPSAKDFNDTVAMDIKVFDASKNIYFQHMIDHRTRFSSAKVVYSKGKETIVESVFTHWINVFGPPKKFMSDNGGEYVNQSFVDLCEKFGVHVATTGAEAPWSNGLVERHHDLISRNVQKIMEDTNCSIEVALAWACHAKNAMSNINGFSPYQLLFGINPVMKSINDPYVSPTVIEDETPSERVAKNIAAIYSARRQQMQCEADEKIKRAMRCNIREVYSEKLETGDLVYYKRDGNKRWRGPGTVVGCDGKIVIVRHGGYIVRCHRIRVVKVNDLYARESEKDADTGDNDPSICAAQQSKEASNNEPFSQAKEMMKNSVGTSDEIPQNRPLDVSESQNVSEQAIMRESVLEDDIAGPTEEDNHRELINSKNNKLCEVKSKLENKRLCINLKDSDPFKIEKAAEIEKWKKNNVYEEIPIEDAEEDIVPISTRWVLNDESGKQKARLVARGFEEEPLDMTERVSPTCRKESLRILFSISASMAWNLKSLDIASAFLQGKPIDRLVYLYPPKEFIKPGMIWKLNKCVYGLSDAAKMWYKNVKEKSENAGLTKCLFDDSLFFQRSPSHDVEGLMTVHVDDFIYAGTNKFESAIDGGILQSVEVKNHDTNSFSYLGLQVEQDPNTHEITVSQSKYVHGIKSIPVSNHRRSQKSYALNHSEYSQLRSGVGQLNWLSGQTRPDLSFSACQLSNNLKDPNVADLLFYNKIVKNLQQEESLPLCFRPIPNILHGFKLITYSDAAYCNLVNSGSQCGFIVFISDMDEKIKNPVTWKSVKLERKCCSTLAAESLALAKAVDYTQLIKETIKQILGESTQVQIECYVDNKGLLELIHKTKDPTEKRLIVTMASLREMVERDEIKVTYIPSKQMPADVLTKKGPTGRVLQSHLVPELY